MGNTTGLGNTMGLSEAERECRHQWPTYEWRRFVRKHRTKNDIQRQQERERDYEACVKKAGEISKGSVQEEKIKETKRNSNIVVHFNMS